jgi:hypothetical protein
MKRVLAGVCVLALTGSAAAATEAQVAAFVAAVEAIGCVVETDAQAVAVEQATGFDEATLGEIVTVLLETGRAVIPASMEGLRLTTGGCS